ncbi:MAG: ribosome recycling factor [Candidatus Peregrinibacteria bacterium]
MPQQILNTAVERFSDAVTHLRGEYAKLQTGRASTALVENLMVDSYGSKMPLKGLASISIPEPTQIAIQPWNRDQITQIEKAIRESNLGLNPRNDGVVIRLMLPPLIEERRKELVKVVHKDAEEAKISIRNARHEAMAELKAMEKEKQISEDELATREKRLQEKVDEFNRQIDEIAKKKESDVMTV